MQDYARAGGTPARPRRRSRTLAAAFGGTAAAALLAAGPAHAINYVTASNGAVWGVHDAAAPGLDTGSIRDVRNSSALIGFGGIRVRLAGSQPRFNGELMRGFGLRYDGYEDFASTSAIDLGGIAISRAIHVERSATWTRYVDTFTNTTGASKTFEVAFGGQTGNAFTSNNANGSSATTNQSQVVETSSTDTAITPADSWSIVASPQNPPPRGPQANWSTNGPAGVVIGSPAPFAGALIAATNFLDTPFDGSLITSGHLANYQGYLNKLTLRPGETRSLVHFVAVGRREDAATAGQQVDRGQNGRLRPRRQPGPRRPADRHALHDRQLQPGGADDPRLPRERLRRRLLLAAPDRRRRRRESRRPARRTTSPARR